MQSNIGARVVLPSAPQPAGPGQKNGPFSDWSARAQSIDELFGIGPTPRGEPRQRAAAPAKKRGKGNDSAKAGPAHEAGPPPRTSAPTTRDARTENAARTGAETPTTTGGPGMNTADNAAQPAAGVGTNDTPTTTTTTRATTWRNPAAPTGGNAPNGMAGAQMTLRCAPPCQHVAASLAELATHVDREHKKYATFIPFHQLDKMGLRPCLHCNKTLVVRDQKEHECIPVGAEIDPAVMQALAEVNVNVGDAMTDLAANLLGYVRKHDPELLEEPLSTVDWMPNRPLIKQLFVACIVKISELIAATNAPGAWLALYMLPAMLFGPLRRNKKGMTNSAVVAARLRLLLTGAWQQLVPTSQRKKRRESRHYEATAAPPQNRERAVVKLARAGDLGRAYRRATATAKILDAGDARVQEKIGGLLPTKNSLPQPVDVDPTFEVQFGADEVRRAVGALGNAAAGVSGWQACHVKAVASSAAGLPALCVIMAKYFYAPAEAQTMFQRTIITPHRKGEDGVRPILAPDTWAKLVAQLVVAREQPAAAATMHPLQVGVGMAGGAEAAIHAIRGYKQRQPGSVGAAFDGTNAYGSISRSSIRTGVDNLDPNNSQLLRRYFNLAYTRAAQTTDRAAYFSMSYDDGVEQGGPLSPLFFSLGLHPIVTGLDQLLREKHQEHVGNFIIHAYLDDVRADVPTVEMAVEAIKFLESRLPDVGIRLNRAKTVVASDHPEAVGAYLHDVKVITHAQDQWLGVPIVADTIAERKAAADTLIPEMTAAISTINEINDLQTRMLLLRHCVNTKSARYARCLPPAAAVPVLKEIQSAVDAAVLEIADAPQHPTTTHARQLFIEAVRRPVGLGGLGLGCLARHASLAYLASVWSSVSEWSKHATLATHTNNFLTSPPAALKAAIADARTLAASVAAIKNAASAAQAAVTVLPPSAIPMPVPAQLDALTCPPLPGQVGTWQSAPRKLQGTLISNAAYLEFHQSRTNRISKIDKSSNSQSNLLADLTLELARLNPATMLPLTCTGTSSLFHLNNNEYRLTLRRVYFLPVIPTLGLRYEDNCTCGRAGQQPPHVSEVHIHNCRREGYFGIRHNAVRDHLAEIVKAGRYLPEIEMPVDPTATSTSAARSDLLVRNFYSATGQGHTAALIDVNIPSALSSEHLPRAAIIPGLQLSKAVTRKLNKYSHAFVPEDHRVVPLCWLSSGEADVNVKAFLWDTGRRVGQLPPEDASWMQPTWTAYHLQALAFTVARETARCWKRMANAM